MPYEISVPTIFGVRHQRAGDHEWFLDWSNWYPADGELGLDGGGFAPLMPDAPVEFLWLRGLLSDDAEMQTRLEVAAISPQGLAWPLVPLTSLPPVAIRDRVRLGRL
jgi:hypothetical protein